MADGTRPWRPRAVLWDLDGTLIDSQPYWQEAEYSLAARHGAGWDDEHSLQLIGADLLEAGAYIREQMVLDLSPEQIVDEMVALVAQRLQERLPWRAGVSGLLADLGSQDVPCGLVTMSYRPLVVPVLAGLPDGVFATVVTGDEVARGKPHPEPYLVAAASLGLQPHECLALEDSETGATSAATAGCRVLVVPSHVPVPEDDRWRITESLAGLSFDHLVDLVA